MSDPIIGKDLTCSLTPVISHLSEGNVVISLINKPIAICGVRDLIIIQTQNRLVVCHKDAVGQVNEIQA